MFTLDQIKRELKALQVYCKANGSVFSRQYLIEGLEDTIENNLTANELAHVDTALLDLITEQVERIPNAQRFYWNKTNNTVDVYFDHVHRIEFDLTHDFQLIRK